MWCTYAVSTIAYHQEEELFYQQRKQLAIRLLFLRLRGLIAFKTRIHMVSSPLFCNIKVIHRTFAVKTKTSITERSLLLDTRKHVCPIFPPIVQLASHVVCFMSVHKIFSFLGKFQHLSWKIRLCFIVFFFEGGSCFWQRHFWPIKSALITTTKPIAQLLGFTRYIRVYSLSNIVYLRKRKVLFKKKLLVKEMPFFLTKKFVECLSSRADWKFLWFTLVISTIFAIIHSSR